MSENLSIKTEIIKSIKRRDFGALENHWLQYVELNDMDTVFLKQCADLLISHKNTKKLSELSELLIEEYAEKDNYPGIVECARILCQKNILAYSLQTPLIKAIRKVYGSSPDLEKYILYSGIEVSDNLQETFSLLDDCLYCDVGQVFQHNTWGIGVVKALDLPQKQVILQLDKKGEHRFTFSGVRQFLTKIPDDHFLARKKKNVDGLKKMVSEDPLGLVRIMVLSHNGSIPTSELKKLLLAGIIKQEDWSKWWNKVKPLLKRDPYIDYTEGAKGGIQLRTEPKELHDELVEKFEQAETIDDKLDIIKELAKHQHAMANAGIISQQIAKDLIDDYQKIPEEDIAQRLVQYYVYDVLKKSLKTELPSFPVTDTDLLKSTTEVSELILSMPDTDYQLRVFNSWLEQNGDGWQDTALKLLSRANPRLADEILRRFKKAGLGTQVETGINQILTAMDNNPETYLWAVQQILKGIWNHSTTAVSHYEVMLELLDLMESLQIRTPRTEQEKKIKSNTLSKVRKMLEENEHQFVRETILDLPLEDAKHLKNTLLSSSALNEGIKTSIDYAINRVRPDLDKPEKAKSSPLEARTLHYCTREVYQQKTQEYQQICTIELHEVGRALAVARAHGDLRENAEYQSAKQRQRILMRTADELHDLLDRARVIDASQINTDRVSFGTRVIVENHSNQEQEEYTIFGIWEANPGKNIISYLSPLGTSFLGKAVNEVVDVDLPQGKVQYKIVHIKNALN